MKRLLLIFFVIASGTSDARVKRLSLGMNIDVYLAHHDLRFTEQALNKVWLKEQISCHFQENSKQCYQLPLLLRMYAEIEPDIKARLDFAYQIKSQIEYSKRKAEEVAWFLYLYCEDSSFMHLLNKHDFESLQTNLQKEALSAKTTIEKLNSGDSAVVRQVLPDLLNHPLNIEMASDLFDALVKISSNKNYSKEIQSYAIDYLIKMGFEAIYIEDVQGKTDFGKISVHSGRCYLSEYLARADKSKVWEFHVAKLSFTGLSNTSNQGRAFVEYLQTLSDYNFQANKVKLDHIFHSKRFIKSQPSLKFLTGDYLMRLNAKVGVEILEMAFREGSPVMKSAIVAKYPKHFEVKKDFWEAILMTGSETELIMVKRNHQVWLRNIGKER